MNTAWLTYAWADNQGATPGDVDFLVQEIEKRRVSVRLDRRDLVVGQPLWPQIERNIADPSRCDAWLYVVTANSLASKPCREELLYALDRALDKRQELFPIIGVFLGHIPPGIPKALSVRLCVSTDEANWADRVAAGIRQRAEPTPAPLVHPFHAHFCNLELAGGDHVFEVRPRLGTWSPFIFGLKDVDAHRFKGWTYAPSAGDANCALGHQSGHMCSPLPEWREAGYHWRGVAQPALSSGMAAHLFLLLEGRPLELRFGVQGDKIYPCTLEPTR